MEAPPVVTRVFDPPWYISRCPLSFSVRKESVVLMGKVLFPQQEADGKWIHGCGWLSHECSHADVFCLTSESERAQIQYEIPPFGIE